jgi:hypothetical protein
MIAHFGKVNMLIHPLVFVLKQMNQSLGSWHTKQLPVHQTRYLKTHINQYLFDMNDGKE